MLATLCLVKKILRSTYPTNNWVIKTMTAVIYSQTIQKPHLYVLHRGGVRDKKLKAEAKAKDTKKFKAKAKNNPSEDRPSRGPG